VLIKENKRYKEKIRLSNKIEIFRLFLKPVSQIILILSTKFPVDIRDFSNVSDISRKVYISGVIFWRCS